MFFQTVTAMRLEWCKLLDTKLRWISDNNSSFVKVVTWYYYPWDFPYLYSSCVEPPIPVTNWVLCMRREWFKVCRIDCSSKIKYLKKSLWI